MKLIIAGSRDLIVPPSFISSCIHMYDLEPTEIVSGASGQEEDGYNVTHYANGIDGCGERWAFDNDLAVRRFSAKFKTLGLKAGPIRNEEMAKYADALLLIWDGVSRGSLSMRTKMIGKPIYEVVVRTRPTVRYP